MSSHSRQIDWFNSWLEPMLAAGTATISLTAILAGILWMLRGPIAKALLGAVSHALDREMESFKSELRQHEDRLKIAMTSKEAESEASRNAALAILSDHQTALNTRRLDAVDTLWAECMRLSISRQAVEIMKHVDFDTALKEASGDPRLSQLMRDLQDMLVPSGTESSEAWRCRPYVSELAWQLFCCYEAAVRIAQIRIEMLKSPKSMPADVISTERTERLLLAALPHRRELIEKLGVEQALYHFLEEIQELLLSELRSTLDGSASDQANVERISSLRSAINAVHT